MQAAMQPTLLNAPITLSEVPSNIPATLGNPSLNAEESYCGRCYIALNDGLNPAAQKVVSFVQSVFIVFASLGSDTNTVASIFRKFNRHLIEVIEILTDSPGYLKKVGRATCHAVGVIDAVQVFTDLDYFYNCKYKEEKIFSFLSKITVVGADVGGALLWFEEMGFVHLNSIAQSMASIRIFSFVPKAVESLSTISGFGSLQRLSGIAATVGDIRIFSFLTKTSMLYFAVRALTLTYIFLALDAAQRLFTSNTELQQTQAGLDLSVYISELALDALLTVGVVNPYVMGVAGAGAIALVIAAFAHEVFNKEEFKKAELMQLKSTQNNPCVIT